MSGLLNAMEGFAVIGIVILTGYVAARMRIGGPQAQKVLNHFSFFISSPCLMFATLSKQELDVIFHPSIIVAFTSALAVAVIFFVLNRIFFHMNAANATVGCLNSMYLNSNNIGLPVAKYILGNPGLVAPILVMQQALFTPIALTALDISTSGKASAKKILTQPLHQPLLIGSLGGILISWISSRVGTFVVPNWLFDPIEMIGESAVPMILMAFGMSLRGSSPVAERKQEREATFTVVFLKNVIMPVIAFLIAYFCMGFRGTVLYGCVVLAALPCGQNVYNYAARYNVGMQFARNGILFSTLSSPIIIAIVAVLLG
ncbi:AEC family transporter [Pseudoscardovia radai]|uniref:AEC family transporter n=1 Tax=Pseudoscardovia radai TaxID=987066 RepID=UPI0039952483